MDEVAFLLGHRDGNVTRAVYVREIVDARRQAARRSRVAAEYGSALKAAQAEDGGRSTDKVLRLRNVYSLLR